MKKELREKTIAQILKRNELFLLKGSRIKRILKDPLRTLPAFFMNVISKMHPFKIRYRTFWGDTMSFYLPEGYAIYYYGFFEANLTNFFIRFLNEGDTFIDIGAHVGYYSLLGSKLVGTYGQVHSFEPTPRTFSTLKENLKNYPQARANNAAAMKDQGMIEFVDYGPKYSAFNSFQSRHGKGLEFLEKSKLPVIKVPAISIDQYCRDAAIAPTLIKIDAEGAEHFILEAMHSILSTIRPIVTIEVAGDDEWKDNREKSIAILSEHGYECYQITADGYLTPHTPLDSYAYDNLAFVHPDNKTRVSDLLS